MYKRQLVDLGSQEVDLGPQFIHLCLEGEHLADAFEVEAPVSYTHLTLPTSDLV